jgi:hypothetical protein
VSNLGGTKCVCVFAAGPDDIRDQITISTGPNLQP